MKKHWWKALSVVLILISIIWGFLGEVRALPILNETIRVLYYHVPMWFAMIALMGVSLVCSILYLNKETPDYDLKAIEAAKTGFLLASLGLLTGMIWARFTWGAFFFFFPKLNGTLVTMLIYLAYFVLRSSVEDARKRARLSAIYNIFAFVMTIVFIGILPRMTDSLHPGNGGNPGFNQYDLDSKMRPIFYSAVLGWILMGWWITNIRIRLKKITNAED